MSIWIKTDKENVDCRTDIDSETMNTRGEQKNPGNIHQIIAKGPDEEAWLLPHGREKLSEK